MANYKFPLGRLNVGGVAVEVNYYKADTDAGKPVTGLNVGDLCWAVDTGIFYVANSTTTWQRNSRQVFSQQVRAAVWPASHGTTETTLLGAGVGSPTLPANWFHTGRSLRLEASGWVQAALTATATLNMRIIKGTTVLAATGAITIPDGYLGNRWSIDMLIMGRSDTTVYCTAAFDVLGPNHNDGFRYQMPAYTASIPSSVITIASASEAINLTAQWGTSSTNNELVNCDAFVLTDN